MPVPTKRCVAGVTESRLPANCAKKTVTAPLPVADVASASLSVSTNASVAASAVMAPSAWIMRS